MSTVNGAISTLQASIARDSALANEFRDAAKRENRSMTSTEKSTLTSLEAHITRSKNSLNQLYAVRDDELATDASMLEPGVPTHAASQYRNRTTSARIGSERLTYRSMKETPRNSDGTPSEPTFLQDLYRAQVLGDYGAMARLDRHGQEMTVEVPGMVQRATATGGVPGFVPPQYLAEYFAEYARAGRPTANLCQSLPLPAEGMVVNIPRVTSPTTTAVQATEGGAIGNTDPASTMLSSPVVTIGGYVVVSRQAMERAALVEEVVTADMAADYNSKLDGQVLNGSGVSGQHLGILGVAGVNAVTWTQATPDLTGATGGWPKLADAIGKVASQRFTGASAVVMSPTEWVWMAAQKDTSGRPLITPEGVSQNPLATSVNGGMQYGQVAGYLFGVPVYLDGNMPSNLGAGTNETRVIAASFNDLMLFEDNGGAPSQMKFEAPNAQNLQVLLVAYGYSAFASGRQPKAISVVSGTGLITPAL